MELNNWENKSEKFLSDVFDGDSDTIVEVLNSESCLDVLEIGFGNGRLLPRLLNETEMFSYYGLDRTKEFVKRAKIDKKSNTRFAHLDVENIEVLSLWIKDRLFDVVILRYVVEHLPRWDKVLSFFNVFSIPLLLISIHTPYTESFTRSAFDVSNNKKNIYTLNFFCESDLDKILSNYSCTVHRYNNVPHTLRVYKLNK